MTQVIESLQTELLTYKEKVSNQETVNQEYKLLLETEKFQRFEECIKNRQLEDIQNSMNLEINSLHEKIDIKCHIIDEKEEKIKFLNKEIDDLFLSKGIDQGTFKQNEEYLKNEIETILKNLMSENIANELMQESMTALSIQHDSLVESNKLLQSEMNLLK